MNSTNRSAQHTYLPFAAEDLAVVFDLWRRTKRAAEIPRCRSTS